MTPGTLVNTIQTRFKTLVTDAYPIPTGFDNVKFTPPANGLYCEVKVLPGQREQVSFGANSLAQWRTPGVLMVSVYDAIGNGTKNVNDIVDSIVALFQGVTASEVVYEVPIPTRLGQQGSKYQITVACPFRHDDFS